MKINIIMFILLAVSLYGKPQFLISIPESSKGLEVVENTREILKKSLSELGYEADFIYLPDERSIRKVDMGECDGEFLRIRNTIEKYSNLVIVNEPIIIMRIYAYTINESDKNINWEKLKNYRVAVIFGNKLVERNLKNQMNKGVFEQVKDYNSAFKMLEKKRVDYVIMESVMLKKERENIFFGKIKNLKRAEPYLIETEMYFSVNKKHSYLADKLADITRKIKKESK